MGGMPIKVYAPSRAPSLPPFDPSRPSVEAVPVTTIPFGQAWIASASSYRNERTDCKNLKPNEDRFKVDPERGLIAIADGITRTVTPDGRYPDPSPSAEAAEIFCSTVQRAAREISRLTPGAMRSIIAQGNQAVREFNNSQFPDFDFANKDRAGLAAVVGIVEGDTLWLASIADCWCVGFRDGAPKKLAWEKTSHARAEYLRLGEISARETLRNKPSHPLSYGAFTGEPEAMRFVEYRAVPLHNMSRLIFASDGLIRIAQETPSVLRTMSAGELIRFGRVVDQVNTETDDKTTVILDRHKQPFWPTRSKNLPLL